MRSPEELRALHPKPEEFDRDFELLGKVQQYLGLWADRSGSGSFHPVRFARTHIALDLMELLYWMTFEVPHLPPGSRLLASLHEFEGVLLDSLAALIRASRPGGLEDEVEDG